MNARRVYRLREGGVDRPGAGGPVVYWMSRDQRVRDNWALLHAVDCARRRRVAVAVAFCLVDDFLGATLRQYGFMLKGLREVERDLATKNIPFFLLRGAPERKIVPFVRDHGASLVVTDFDPLRIKRRWKEHVIARADIPFDEVDARNIVPCRLASQKQEYGAYTLRPKIRRLLPEFLEPYPALREHPYRWKGRVTPVSWNAVIRSLRVDRTVGDVDWIVPGEAAARKALRRFISSGLSSYDRRRNDPSLDGQSGLSPYLHFGQLSAQRLALEVLKSGVPRAAKDAFLEELIVRRELSDNFCLYNKDYDNTRGFPAWARKTLDEHRGDRRPYRYSVRQLEEARTHDDLWNAAQTEMVKRGKMHGYLRMYWAKKILEWTPSPEKAVETAIYLNDRYELDGRDPNGYAGIAWSLGGVHDRAWGERDVFGKIRYMSYNGCRSKFDIRRYVRLVEEL